MNARPVACQQLASESGSLAILHEVTRESKFTEYGALFMASSIGFCG
jgi:hypothetical protein